MDSDKLNDLVRDVAEECIAFAEFQLKSRKIPYDPIVISLQAFTLYLNWQEAVNKQILGMCQDMQKKMADGVKTDYSMESLNADSG